MEYEVNTILTAASELCPSFTPETVTEVEEGTDDIYRITGTNNNHPETAYLKICAINNRLSCLSEPHIQRRINQQTDIPGPTVLGYSPATDIIDAPHFMNSHISGTHPQETWSIAKLKTVITKMGEMLGSIHSTFNDEFTASGEVFAEETGWELDQPRPWDDFLLTALEEVLDDAEDQFSEYVSPIIDYGNNSRKTIKNRTNMSLLHGDYRFENVLVNRHKTNEPEVTGVIDWGRTVSGDPYYNIARACHFIVRDTPPELTEKTIQASFIKGYDKTGQFNEEKYESVKELYYLHTMAVEMKWFSTWYGALSERNRNQRKNILEYTIEKIVE